MQDAKQRYDENNKIIILNPDEIETLQDYLLKIQMVGEYNDDDTPLDSFDSECHNKEGGIIQSCSERYSEDDLMLMINLSE